ncbi:MAG: hypothetical protein C0436_00060 [Alphaproteobacteria bacterium]|nr:hypothetical protein [Alphaproteobacteria bacterium]
MTPEYMYNEMTWREIQDALDYVHMYELNERHYAHKPYNKNKKITEWWARKEEKPDKALREFRAALEKDTK